MIILFVSSASFFNQENLRLFQADPVSDEWKSYVNYVDEMVISGFQNSIDCSLKFFLENTGRVSVFLLWEESSEPQIAVDFFYLITFDFITFITQINSK